MIFWSDKPHRCSSSAQQACSTKLSRQARQSLELERQGPLSYFLHFWNPCEKSFKISITQPNPASSYEKWAPLMYNQIEVIFMFDCWYVNPWERHPHRNKEPLSVLGKIDTFRVANIGYTGNVLFGRTPNLTLLSCSCPRIRIAPFTRQF